MVFPLEIDGFNGLPLKHDDFPQQTVTNYQRVKTSVSKSTRLIPFFSAGDYPNNQLLSGTIQVGKEWTAEQAEQDQEQQNYGCSMLW